MSYGPTGTEFEYSRALASPDSRLNSSCPASYNCSTTISSTNETLVSFDIGLAPSYVSIASCTLSCIGSLLILTTFCLLKDMRTATQGIITFLAIADFISASGYIIGSINFITHFNGTDPLNCDLFEALCKAQSTITSWSSLVSFCWTVILAFHFNMIIVYKRFQLSKRLIPLYAVLAWAGPLLIIIPLLALDKLGYAPYAASNWCFIKDSNYSALRNDALTVALILVGGKGWEILSYISVILLYLLIFCHINQSRRQLRNTHMEPKVLQVEWRLLAIPGLFILLRMWGTIQMIFSISISTSGQCVRETDHNVFVALGILQAIGDGGQGWGNALLYVFLSPVIRAKLCSKFCGVCVDVMERGLGGVLDNDTDSTHKALNRRVRQINVNKEDESSSSLVPRPATGYNVRRYDSTSSFSDHSDHSYMYNKDNYRNFENSSAA